MARSYESRPERPGIACSPRFHTAASAEVIAEAEDRLGVRLPPALRSLLMQANGVTETMVVDGGEWFDSMQVLWPVAEILERNRFYRAASEDGIYSRNFRGLVFFADAGCDGILFGFSVGDDGACGASVMVWKPILDELEEVAPSLDEFVTGWLTGRIPV